MDFHSPLLAGGAAGFAATMNGSAGGSAVGHCQHQPARRHCRARDRKGGEAEAALDQHSADEGAAGVA